MEVSCCAERYEQWILSEPLAFLWQVIAVIHASEPLLALGKVCMFRTVQGHNAMTSQVQPLFVVSNHGVRFFGARDFYKYDCTSCLSCNFMHESTDKT